MTEEHTISLYGFNVTREGSRSPSGHVAVSYDDDFTVEMQYDYQQLNFQGLLRVRTH